LSDTLDHVGPVARSVGDAAVVLQAIAGHDSRDATSLLQPVEAYGAAVGSSIAGVRIGIDRDYCTSEVDREVSAAVNAAVDVLAALGAEVREISMPSLADTLSAWLTIFSADALAVHQKWYPARADDYGPSFRAFLDSGSRLSAVDYSKAQVTRLSLKRRLEAVFQEVDVVACPACAEPAQELGDRSIEDAFAIRSVGFTTPYNLTGSPTITLPSGFNAGGLPLSLQLVGRDLDEMLLIKTAFAYEQASDWHLRHPVL
jgi:amidase